MTGRLAVDFGTSNTLVARWDEALQEGVPIHIPDYGRKIQQGDQQFSLVPSLIHYDPDQRRWVGNQVLERDLYRSPRTFRWMKRYISNRSPNKIKVDGQLVSYTQAGRDFLSAVLGFAAAELNSSGQEVAFSVPVEAFEHYENWLAEVATAAGMPRFRLIDEPSAAALGYGAPIQPGDVYLIFDFGGGTLHASVILIEETLQASVGRRCRVLGKAGTDMGGSTLDQWLFQEVLRQNDCYDGDQDVREMSTALLVECERAKLELSFQEATEIRVAHPETGRPLTAGLDRDRFEKLLDQHDAFTRIGHTVRRALTKAHERGYSEDDVKQVLMVGGGSQIPSVQRQLRQIFGRDRVLLNRPLDAVARGAAAFVAGVDFYDHIQHDYAIRAVDTTTGDETFRVIVERGTPYPTREPLARLTVKATHHGQAQLGIAIYEMAEKNRAEDGQGVEIVFDPSGAARVRQLTPEDREQRARFWMNENNPTFLLLESPARQGDRCFDVQFSIDQNKRLLITARDLTSGRLTHQDYPVVKLT